MRKGCRIFFGFGSISLQCSLNQVLIYFRDNFCGFFNDYVGKLVLESYEYLAGLKETTSNICWFQDMDMLLDSFMIHFRESFGLDLYMYRDEVTEHPSQQKVRGELTI